MNSLNIQYLENVPISLAMVRTISLLGEYKGKQELFTKQSPQVLETLKLAAMIQSAESSNRIEGITVLPERLKALLLQKQKPKDRPEAEIVGYRRVLDKIHTQFDSIPLSTGTLLKFHSDMFKNIGLAAGIWKQKDNFIEERLPDGRWVTRFVPVKADQTLFYMEKSCELFNELWAEGKVNKLSLIAAFILDFLCIHPFADGNGRISRLLTVLLLHKAGYDVVRFISLERIIEETKTSYYETLREASQGWHESKHNLRTWWDYFFITLLSSYQELETRIGNITKGRGAKTELIENAVRNMPLTFAISDIERTCPSVGRDMIRVVLNRLRRKGLLECSRLGRSAKWKKKGD